MGDTHLLQAGYYRLISAWRGYNFRKVYRVQRIISSELLDIIPHASGFLFAEKSVSGGEAKVGFFSYEQAKREVFPITAKTYLTHKFGEKYRKIIDTVGDFINCSASPLGKGGTIVLFDEGEIYIFDPKGVKTWSGNITYADKPIYGFAVDGKEVWCTVPECNAIVCYSPTEGRVTMRIGGVNTAAFACPKGISKNGETIFVCNEETNTVRTVNISNYAVKDHRSFKESIKEYFKVADTEYVVLESGIYIMEEDD